MELTDITCDLKSIVRTGYGISQPQVDTKYILNTDSLVRGNNTMDIRFDYLTSVDHSYVRTQDNSF